MLDRAWERIASSINIQLINKLYVVELKIYNYFQGAGVIIKDMQRQKDCKKQKNWDWIEIVFSGYERTQIMKLKMSTFQNKYLPHIQKDYKMKCFRTQLLIQLFFHSYHSQFCHFNYANNILYPIFCRNHVAIRVSELLPPHIDEKGSNDFFSCSLTSCQI